MCGRRMRRHALELYFWLNFLNIPINDKMNMKHPTLRGLSPEYEKEGFLQHPLILPRMIHQNHETLGQVLEAEG